MSEGRTPTDVDRIADSFVDEFCTHDPVMATFFGIAGHDDRLPEYSPSWYADRSRTRQRTLAALGQVEPVDANDRITVAALRSELEISERIRGDRRRRGRTAQHRLARAEPARHVRHHADEHRGRLGGRGRPAGRGPGVGRRVHGVAAVRRRTRTRGGAAPGARRHRTEPREHRPGRLLRDLRPRGRARGGRRASRAAARRAGAPPPSARARPTPTSPACSRTSCCRRRGPADAVGPGGVRPALALLPRHERRPGRDLRVGAAGAGRDHRRDAAHRRADRPRRRRRRGHRPARQRPGPPAPRHRRAQGLDAGDVRRRRGRPGRRRTSTFPTAIRRLECRIAPDDVGRHLLHRSERGPGHPAGADVVVGARRRDRVLDLARTHHRLPRGRAGPSPPGRPDRLPQRRCSTAGAGWCRGSAGTARAGRSTPSG